jgi:hypothetical protein
MADQQSTSDRARRVQQFISQARQGDGGMRAWLARRAQVMQARTNEAALAKARGDQQQALRAAMATPGALQLAESTQPGAATGGPAPIAPRQPTTPGPTPAVVQAQTMGPAASAPASAPAPAATPSPFASLESPTMAPMIPRNLGGSMPVDFAGFDEGGNPKDTSGNFMMPPPGIDRMSWGAALTRQIQRSADPAGFDAQQQAQVQSRNAYQIARDAAQGQMLPGSFGANGVDYGQAQADPSAALRAFDASGYTEQQALADGWGTGVGTPGWETTSMNQRMNPNGNNRAVSPERMAQLAATPYTAPAALAPTQLSAAVQPATQANAQQYTAQPMTANNAQQYQLAPSQPATQAPAATAPAATQAPAAVAPTASANPSANLAAAIQRSNAPAAPAAPRTAVPPAYRAAPGPAAPPAAPAAPAAPRANDDDVRNALTAQPRASGAMPRMPGSRVGLG